METKSVTVEHGDAVTGKPASTHPSTTSKGELFPSVRRFWDEVDRVFQEGAIGRAWPSLFGRDALSKRLEDLEKEAFLPAIEVEEKEGSIVVRADLPGLEKKDIDVELTGEGVIIRGERHGRTEEKKNGYYRSERTYGSFYRYVPFPAGTIAEHGDATYKDGVLEVTLATKKNGRKVAID